MNLLNAGACALFLGIMLAILFLRLSDHEHELLGMAKLPRRDRWLSAIAIVMATTLLCGFYFWASLRAGCLETAEVQPGSGQYWRFVYHCTLFALLIIATAIDFDCYVIPDSITVPGMILGILGAGILGEVQICHLWVDWSFAVPQLRGPYIPPWYDAHRHFHGFAWSATGLIVGGALTWLARQISSRVLGQEAMGTGDITLMAMIGSFLGWQAVTLVFLVAPMTGLIVGFFVRMLSGKTYLPYGPWLSMAAILVLFNWSRLWAQTRIIFSDWLSVLVLGTIGSVGFVVLLGMIRLYKSIPTRPRTASK